MVTFYGQLSCTASAPAFLTCGYYQVVFLADFALFLLRVPFQDVCLLHGLPPSTSCVEPRFYAAPFKFEFNQLVIFIEKFSPLPGFERGSSLVPSRYATNWAILAWICFHPYKSYFSLAPTQWVWVRIQKFNWLNTVNIRTTDIFLMLSPLTTFYVPYFCHHYTYYKLQYPCQSSVLSAIHLLLTHSCLSRCAYRVSWTISLEAWVIPYA